MTSSPYAQVGPKLVDQGFSAIPCRPGFKIPGVYRGGKWFNESDWTRFCERLPTNIETEIWSTWPEAGVCIALGFNDVVAVDIDTDQHEIVAAIESALPDISFVQKAGRKGRTSFYRAGPAVVSKAFSINDERVLDLLCKGKQTVIPPTIHKDTGEPYRWLSGTLEHVSPENLPMLPDDIAERLAETLAPFGYEAPVERSEPLGEGSGAWDDVKAMALANLDAWVPHLGIGAKRKGSSWRAQAKWRNGDGFNVSFHPKGIKDYGGAREEGYSAIDVTMKALNMKDHEALDWLKGKLNIQDPPRLHFNVRKPGEAEPVGEMELAADLVTNAISSVANLLDQAGEIVTADMRVSEARDVATFVVSNKPDPLAVFEPWVGVDWTRPGGDLGLLADYFEASARWPNRGLAVLGALSVISGLCGRHLYGPTGTSLNVYIAAAAGTGEGKDSVFKKIGTALRLAGQKELYELSFPLSNTAIEDMLVDKPCVVVCVDEVGITLFQKVLNPNAGGWERDIKASLNSLHSRQIGNEPFATKRHAKDRRGSKELTREEVQSPSLTIFGVGTPDSIWKAIKSAVLEDGFLNRWLILPISGGQPKNRDHQSAKIDSELVDRLASIPPMGNGFTLPGGDTITPPGGVFSRFAVIEEQGVPWESAAVDEWTNKLEDLARNLSRSDGTASALRPLLARVFEQACSLAACHAVGRVGREKATVTREDFAWGLSLVLTSVRYMAEKAEGLSEDEFQARYQAMRTAIKKGDKGTPGRIKRRELRKIVVVKEQVFDELVKLLVETGEIMIPAVPKAAHRPPTVYVWTGD